MESGRFFVIEGSDGSGKTSQTTRLIERLRQADWSVAHFSFPRYEQPGAYLVEAYLGGKYGDAETVTAYQAGLLYALDRFDARLDIKQALTQNQVVISDRFVGSNLAHQGSKINQRFERVQFFDWVLNLEFDLLDIPQPDLNLILMVDAHTSKELTSDRDQTDIHDDSHHQITSRRVFRELVDIYPDDYRLIDCQPDGQLLSLQTINDQLYQIITEEMTDNPQAQ